jgi:hypothetical protein
LTAIALTELRSTGPNLVQALNSLLDQ